MLLTQSCEHFMYSKVFDHIDNCTAEYYKYHPNSYNKKVKSKTCSRVTNRMCVINKYCKGDEECIAEAKKVYPDDFTTGSDAKYCMILVKETKERNEKRQTFKGSFYCKTDKRDDEFCKKYGI